MSRFVVGLACTGGDQSTHNHVFLEAAQLIAFAHDGSFGQHAGCFLEGSGADETVRGQRCFGNTQQQIGERSGQFSFAAQGVVGVEHFRTLDLFTGDVIGITHVVDDHAAQHLAHDDLDVFVVDLHALQAVDVLHFIDDVTCQLFGAQKAQDVLRIGWAVNHTLALVDDLAFVHQDVFLFGHEVFPHRAFWIGDLQPHFAFGFLAEGHGAGHLGQHTLVFR